MDAALNLIQKMKLTFEKATRNTYISATKDTFIALIYLVVAASVFGLVANVLTYFDILHKASDTISAFVMIIFSLLGILTAILAPRNLATHINAKMEGTHKIDVGLLTITSVVAFCILTNRLEGLTDISSYGAEQITLALITTFATGKIFSLALSHLSFDLPEGYPTNIEHYLKEIIAVLVSIIFAVAINLAVLNTYNQPFSSLLLRVVIPIFDVFNSFGGVVFIAGFMALIWFSGVHDSSVVDPFIMGAALYFVVQNYAMVQIGVQPTGILTPATRYFIMATGGTGATLVPCLMFKYLSKHEELRQIGKEAWKPVFCGINEPVLYGIPLVQNPQFLIPFVLAPMANVVVYSVFALYFDMGGFAYVLPWFTPAPIAIVICAGFKPLSILLVAAIFGIDFLIYLPFFRKFDRDYKDSYAEDTSQQDGLMSDNTKIKLNGKRILILCAGGGTSSIIAERMQTQARKEGLEIVVDSGAYGTHSDLLSSYDMIVLAPQVLSYLPALKEEAKGLQLRCTGLSANDYMSILQNPIKGLNICSEELSEE